MPSLAIQVAWLFLLAIPAACIAWTVTHEEVFREPREYCIRKSRACKRVYQRKFFYLFTCEYCFSHYVVIAILFFTGYHLLLNDWRGYVLAGFSVVWIANLYMSIFALLRSGLKNENLEASLKEEQLGKS